MLIEKNISIILEQVLQPLNDLRFFETFNVERHQMRHSNDAIVVLWKIASN